MVPLFLAQVLWLQGFPDKALELAAAYALAGMELRGNVYYNDIEDYIERYRQADYASHLFDLYARLLRR